MNFVLFFEIGSIIVFGCDLLSLILSVAVYCTAVSKTNLFILIVLMLSVPSILILWQNRMSWLLRTTMLNVFGLMRLRFAFETIGFLQNLTLRSAFDCRDVFFSADFTVDVALVVGDPLINPCGEAVLVDHKLIFLICHFVELALNFGISVLCPMLRRLTTWVELQWPLQGLGPNWGVRREETLMIDDDGPSPVVVGNDRKVRLRVTREEFVLVFVFETLLLLFQPTI